MDKSNNQKKILKYFILAQNVSVEEQENIAS